MALHGILGDIHGNREALEAALARLDELGVSRIACVGDIVGYNADPDACVEILESRGARCIAGNHDVIAVGELGFERCSNKAMHALKRTRRALRERTADFLRDLPRHLVLQPGVLLMHAGVRDVQHYMTRPAHARENARFLLEDFPGSRICFYGHTHEQRIFEVDGDEVASMLASDLADPAAPRALDASGLRVSFVNPGSVDAARKHGPKQAQFAVFDGDALTVSFHHTDYDDSAAEARASDGGYRLEPWRDRLYAISRRIRLHAPFGSGRRSPA
jgi:predicted phosphodiesterase